MGARGPAVLLLGALAWLGGAQAAEDDPIMNAGAPMYPVGVQYDESVPTPAEFLGHELGQAPVRQIGRAHV